MLDVPALNVKLVIVPASMAETVPLKVTVLEPRVIVLTLLFEDDKEPAVTLKFLVSNVPLVTVKAVVPIFNASASSTEPP